MFCSDYYENTLYPFQDKVLNALKKCELPFYLTGGTAVSRGYFNHRYSDDLDFFVNAEKKFLFYVEKATKALQSEGFSVDFANASSGDFVRIFIKQSDFFENKMKVDFVNDVPFHFGKIKSTKVYYKTDSLRNILSNKFSALYRIAAKDVEDLCEIAKHIPFDWKKIIDEANEKEAGIDLKEVVQIFSCFSDDDFAKIKWTKKFDAADFRKTVNAAAFDILNKAKNSLKK